MNTKDVVDVVDGRTRRTERSGGRKEAEDGKKRRTRGHGGMEDAEDGGMRTTEGRRDGLDMNINL